MAELIGRFREGDRVGKAKPGGGVPVGAAGRVIEVAGVDLYLVSWDEPIEVETIGLDGAPEEPYPASTGTRERGEDLVALDDEDQQ